MLFRPLIVLVVVSLATGKKSSGGGHETTTVATGAKGKSPVNPAVFKEIPSLVELPEEEEVVEGANATGEHHLSATHAGGSGQRYQIAKFDWNKVSPPFIIALWILLACVAKMIFHLSKRFSSIFPDSSLLITVGLIVGIILHFARQENSQFVLPEYAFFYFLLPPIVFDAGYFMPNRAFFDNLGAILVYAVIGTLWNMLTIGLSLWGIGKTGLFNWPTPLLDVLLFTSLISAVDPVAVLVVFEEVHVNEVLFIIVFGESLLNDAVTVVLYHLFEAFAEIGEENILAVDIVSGFISFFVVGLGGVLVGLCWSVIVSYTTRWAKHVPVLEPLFVFVMAYCAYLTAEMFHLSGILSIVFCGIAMRQYVEGNISRKSLTTVKYFTKMMSVSCETIIFMFLGLSTVSTDHGWDTAFVGLTVLFCLVYRALGTVLLTYFVNRTRVNKIGARDQFIMSYGGLRGAIAYGLVIALNEEHIVGKKMYVTATVAVIYFTVFLQGMTIKPLVNFLKVRKAHKAEESMNQKLFDRMLDHMLTGFEDVLGFRGHHWLRDKYEFYNTKYLKPILMRDPPKSADMPILIKTFTKLNLKEAIHYSHKSGASTTNLYTSETNLIRISRSANNLARSNPAFTHSNETLRNVHNHVDEPHMRRKPHITLSEDSVLDPAFLNPGWEPEKDPLDWEGDALSTASHHLTADYVPRKILKTGRSPSRLTNNVSFNKDLDKNMVPPDRKHTVADAPKPKADIDYITFTVPTESERAKEDKEALEMRHYTVQELEFPWKRKYTVVEDSLRPNLTVPNLVLFKEETHEQMLQENHKNQLIAEQQRSNKRDASVSVDLITPLAQNCSHLNSYPGDLSRGIPGRHSGVLTLSPSKLSQLGKSRSSENLNSVDSQTSDGPSF